MKKNRFLRFCILTAAILLLLCGNAFAKNVSKVLPLKPNITVKQRKIATKKTGNGSDRITYFYKAVAPSEGYFTVTVKKGTSKYDAKLNFYAKPGSKLLASDDNAKTVVRRFPVSKGTFYFRARSGNTIQYKFTKVMQRENYCAAKALPLKRGKKAVACQTPEYHFDRWYKIYLPKKQAVRVWYDNDFCHLSVCDEKIKFRLDKYIDGSDNEWPSFKTEILPKGTYYIAVMGPNHLDYHEDDEGYYVDTFYWK